MEALATLAGGLLLAVTGTLVAALLRVRGAAAFFVATLVVAGAEIVLLSIGLSLVHQLRSGWMLLGQAALAAVAAFLWLRAGRPAIPVPRVPPRATLVEAVRAHPGAAGMAGVAVVALAFQLLMGLATAPNNWDSMSYHLARVGYWLQFDSAMHYDAGTLRQLASPPNGELLQAWTILMAGSDRLAASVQWTALVGLAATTFLGARAVGFDRPASVFAASLFVVLPQPILQAASTQNDLIASFFIAASVVFAMRGLRERALGEVAVSAVALGVAVGAKGTALIALPWIGLIVAVVVWRGARDARLLLRGAAVAVVAVVALGSFNYALNQDRYGAPLADLRELTDRTAPLWPNTAQVMWTFVDSPGISIEWLNLAVERPALRFFRGVAPLDLSRWAADSRVGEDGTAYGLLGIGLLALFAIVALARRTPWDRRVLAMAGLGFLAVFIYTTEQSPFLGRSMMPAFAIAAPLMAYLYARGWLRAGAAALALLALVPCLLVNQNKPVLTSLNTPPYVKQNRVDQLTLIRPEMAKVLASLDRVVAQDAPLGLVHDEDSWDYPLFGPRLERRVLPIDKEDATRETMASESLAGVVFLNVEPPEGLAARRLVPDLNYWFAPGDS